MSITELSAEKLVCILIEVATDLREEYGICAECILDYSKTGPECDC